MNGFWLFRPQYLVVAWWADRNSGCGNSISDRLLATALGAMGVAMIPSVTIRAAEFLFLHDRVRRISWSALVET